MFGISRIRSLPLRQAFLPVFKECSPLPIPGNTVFGRRTTSATKRSMVSSLPSLFSGVSARVRGQRLQRLSADFLSILHAVSFEHPSSQRSPIRGLAISGGSCGRPHPPVYRTPNSRRKAETPLPAGSPEGEVSAAFRTVVTHSDFGTSNVS